MKSVIIFLAFVVCCFAYLNSEKEDLILDISQRPSPINPDVIGEVQPESTIIEYGSHEKVPLEYGPNVINLNEWTPVSFLNPIPKNDRNEKQKAVSDTFTIEQNVTSNDKFISEIASLTAEIKKNEDDINQAIEKIKELQSNSKLTANKDINGDYRDCKNVDTDSAKKLGHEAKEEKHNIESSLVHHQRLTTGNGNGEILNTSHLDGGASENLIHNKEDIIKDHIIGNENNKTLIKSNKNTIFQNTKKEQLERKIEEDKPEASVANRNKRSTLNYVLNSNMIPRNLYPEAGLLHIRNKWAATDDFNERDLITGPQFWSLILPYVEPRLNKFKRDLDQSDRTRESELINYNILHNLFSPSNQKAEQKDGSKADNVAPQPIPKLSDHKRQQSSFLKNDARKVDLDQQKIFSSSEKHNNEEEKEMKEYSHINKEKDEHHYHNTKENQYSIQDLHKSSAESQNNNEEIMTKNIEHDDEYSEANQSQYMRLLSNSESRLTQTPETDTKTDLGQDEKMLVRHRPLSVAELFARAQRKSYSE